MAIIAIIVYPDYIESAKRAQEPSVSVYNSRLTKSPPRRILYLHRVYFDNKTDIKNYKIIYLIYKHLKYKIHF